MTPTPSTGRTERIHERAPDPAEAADRPLESKAGDEPLASRDEPSARTRDGQDAHHRLNTPAGAVDPAADSDPYRAATADDDADRASGVRGVGEDAEQG